MRNMIKRTETDEKRRNNGNKPGRTGTTLRLILPISPKDGGINTPRYELLTRENREHYAPHSSLFLPKKEVHFAHHFSSFSPKKEVHFAHHSLLFSQRRRYTLRIILSFSLRRRSTLRRVLPSLPCSPGTTVGIVHPTHVARVPRWA